MGAATSSHGRSQPRGRARTHQHLLVVPCVTLLLGSMVSMGSMRKQYKYSAPTLPLTLLLAAPAREIHVAGSVSSFGFSV